MSFSRHYDVFGLLLSFRVLPEEVEGKFALMEAVVPPGLGAPPNSHAGETETFRVLEGEFMFMINGQPVPARAGDTLVVPDGAPHAFRCTGNAPGRLLILNAPGRMHQQFFTGIGQALPQPLTSIASHREQIGAEAASALLLRLSGGEPARIIDVGFRLIPGATA